VVVDPAVKASSRGTKNTVAQTTSYLVVWHMPTNVVSYFWIHLRLCCLKLFPEISDEIPVLSPLLRNIDHFVLRINLVLYINIAVFFTTAI